MCNISTWHWLILIAINFTWWLGMVYLLPALGLDPAPKTDKICMYGCDDNRRRLGAISSEPQMCQATLDGDMCDMNTTELQHACSQLQSNASMSSYWNQCRKCTDAMSSSGYKDISSEQTLAYLFLYAVIGWVIVLAQLMIVMSIRQRMRKILAFHETTDPENVADLLRKLEQVVIAHQQKQLQNHNGADMDAQFLLRNNSDERTDLLEFHDLHHAHLVNIDAGAHDTEADHIMVFEKDGATWTSNDFLSIRDYELLVFLTQLNQLVIDFYFGFYFVREYDHWILWLHYWSTNERMLLFAVRRYGPARA